MIEKIKKLSETLKELLIGILFYGILVEVIGVWIVQDKVYFTIGLWFVTLFGKKEKSYLLLRNKGFLFVLIRGHFANIYNITRAFRINHIAIKSPIGCHFVGTDKVLFFSINIDSC